MKKILTYIIVILAVSSCSSYQKLLKSPNAEEKLAAAKQYFLEKKYSKSSALLSDVASVYKGTKKAEEILYLLGESYMGMTDYYSASEYYQAYVKNYPRGEYAKECYFQMAYCHYLASPEARLDQTSTYAALSAFSEFIQLYPESDKAQEAYGYIDELNNKLSYKGYIEAKLYYNLGTYLGNNYRSAVIVAENVLKEFPETAHREGLSFLILKSKYNEAKLSIDAKRKERFSEVIDEYYKYSSEFQNSKNIKEAERLFSEAKKYTSSNQ
jgi:outer membrane protein assembly factor BamD